ncbi:MAG TPA: hypothetical protein VIJ68_03355 [Candidatus Saccharimonadales bacterium]
MISGGTAAREELFFDTHRDDLYELFVALDRERQWADGPAELLPYTQAKWVGREHGNSVEKDQFTSESEEAAQEIFTRIGLRGEVLPPKDSYEQAVIIGGMMRVNRERTGFTKQLLDEGRIKTKQIVFWAGQRARERRDDAEVSKMDMAALSANAWVRDELSLSSVPGKESFATETHLTRLAYLEAFGPQAVLKATSLRTEQGEAASYTLKTDDYPDFVLMNCQAVVRARGPARHTTVSCAAEWLETVAPRVASKVLLVAGNPHTLRNARDIQAVIRHQDRADIDLSVCGPAAAPNASIQLFLGEIGRLLYTDVQLQQQA